MNPYTSGSVKMTEHSKSKTMLCKIIALHFQKKNQRMSNLSKATIPILERIIKENNINTDSMEAEILSKKLQERQEARDREADYKMRIANIEEKNKQDKLLIESRWQKLWPNRELWIDCYLRIKYGKIVVVTDEMRAQRDKQRERFFQKVIPPGAQVQRINANAVVVNGVCVEYVRFSGFEYTEDARQRYLEYYNTEEGFKRVIVGELCKNDSKMPKRVIRCLPDNKEIIYSLKW